MTFNEIDKQIFHDFQYINWHEKFSSFLIPSKIIPLPSEFIDYLKEDGIYLPSDHLFKVQYDDDQQDYNEEETFPESMKINRRDFKNFISQFEGTDETSEDENESNQEENNVKNSVQLQQQFSRLIKEIEDNIQLLGKKVFPKLNWSAPKDAHWMMPDTSLCCHSASDIFLLLKSSDFINFDLELEPDSFYLVLKKWINLNPSLEFRLFIKNNQLVAISQRDIYHFYPFLLDSREKIQEALTCFWKENVEGKFQSKDYVLDLYVEADENWNRNRIYIIDFNAFHSSTDSLLFNWEEVEQIFGSTIRVIESEQMAQSYHKSSPIYTSNRLPQEALSLLF